MSIDRKKLLQQRANALTAASQQGLPQNIRDKFKQAADQAGMVLGLQDAQARELAADNPLLQNPDGTSSAPSLEVQPGGV